MLRYLISVLSVSAFVYSIALDSNCRYIQHLSEREQQSRGSNPNVGLCAPATCASKSGVEVLCTTENQKCTSCSNGLQGLSAPIATYQVIGDGCYTAGQSSTGYNNTNSQAQCGLCNQWSGVCVSNQPGTLTCNLTVNSTVVCFQKGVTLPDSISPESSGTGPGTQ